MPPDGPAPPTPTRRRRAGADDDRRADDAAPAGRRRTRRRRAGDRRRRRRAEPSDAGDARPSRRPTTADDDESRPTSARCSRSCVRAADDGPGGRAAERRRRARRRRVAASRRPRRARRRAPRPSESDDAERREPDERADTRPGRCSRRATTPSPTPRTTSSRRAKRALQDEQNDVLDGLRRQRGKIDVAKVLPPLDDQLARWAHVLQPAVDAAYAAGAASVGGSGRRPSAPRPGRCSPSSPTVGGHAACASGWSRRSSSIDARTPADIEIAIAQRLGARYREWRGAAPRSGARRRAGRRATPGASTTPRPTVPACGGCRAVVGQVPRLRRQRARTDGAGQRLPDRAAAPAGAPRVPLPARASTAPDARCHASSPRPPLPLGCAPDARPHGSSPDADSASVAGSSASVVVARRAAVQPAGPGRLLHRLPLVRLARARAARGAACSRPGSRPRSCSRSCSS